MTSSKAPRDQRLCISTWRLADRLIIVIFSYLRLLPDNAHVDVIRIRKPRYSLYTDAKHHHCHKPIITHHVFHSKSALYTVTHWSMTHWAIIQAFTGNLMSESTTVVTITMAMVICPRITWSISLSLWCLVSFSGYFLLTRCEHDKLFHHFHSQL